MMNKGYWSVPILAGLSLSGGAVGLLSAVSAAPDFATMDLSEAERVAVFKAAGANQRKGKWIICVPPAGAGAPEPEGAVIDSVRDLNGDGRPEAVVSEGGSYCYGFTGVGFQLLSKQSDGGWRVITGDTGMPTFLKTKGVGGWPDISVGGPGFCFPVQRWNGKAYTLNRHEYEGKRCKPQR